MSFRFMSVTQGMPAARVCASPASFRLPSEAKPIRFGRFLAVRAKPNSAVSAGFSAIGAKGKTARVRDPFSRPVCSSAREPRNTTFAGRYEIETPFDLDQCVVGGGDIYAFEFAKLSGTPLVSQDARARRVAQRAQIPTEVRPLVLRIPTKRLGSQSAASDRVRLTGRGRRRLAPAS